MQVIYMDKKDKTKVVNPMWGGRFSSSPSQTMHEFNASINFDARLYSQDILASKVHANMLAACDLITEAEASDICRGLDIVEKEIASGQFEFKLEMSKFSIKYWNKKVISYKFDFYEHDDPYTLKDDVDGVPDMKVWRGKT